MIPQSKENQRKTQLAQLLQEGHDLALQRARKIIKEWERDDPTSGYPAMYRGALAGLRQDFEKALACFDEAIKRDPSVALFWKNRATPLARLSRKKEALESIQRALALSETVAEELSCLCMFGELLIEDGHLLEAEHIFRKIARMGYRSDGLFFSLWLQREYREALEALLAFVDLSSHSGMLSVPPPESDRYLLNTLSEHLLSFLQEGHPPDRILEALEVPPDDIDTQAFLDWWRKLLEDESWLSEMQETLHILSVPGWKERILEAKDEPPEDRVSLAELGC